MVDAAGTASTGTATLAIGPAIGNLTVSSPSLTVAENAAATAIDTTAPTDPNYPTAGLTITAATLPGALWIASDT